MLYTKTPHTKTVNSKFKPSYYAAYAAKNISSFSVRFILICIALLTLNACQTPSPKPAIKTEKQVTDINGLDEQQAANYQLALKALEQQDFTKAQSLLVKLTNQKPNLAGPWANLGLLNLMQNKLTKAHEYLSKALTLNPKMPEALNLMGVISTHNRNIKQAEDYYLSAIKHNNNYANAYYNLALLYDIYLQDIAKAASNYRQYLKLIDNKDETTLSWVEQLEVSLKQ
ncbi:hypothetical protein [Aliikangiella sp. IMCC44359]|uniref:hypothetical protein n=1 Tax=Aliikangiella sp. IMCC44359 TaxID=3459125 RepID=UPI00403B26D2